jgi:rhodanese-related sulfurtransferase
MQERQPADNSLCLYYRVVLEKIMRQHPVYQFLSVFLSPALALLSCTAGGNNMNLPAQISANDLDQQIKSGIAPVIVDVRSAYEYRKGHIPGAIHMPFWQSFFLANDLSAPGDRPVVVYCQHGPRAVIAKFALRLAGHADVRYLDGHMSGWEHAGLPLETAPPD